MVQEAQPVLLQFRLGELSDELLYNGVDGSYNYGHRHHFYHHRHQNRYHHHHGLYDALAVSFCDLWSL